MDGSGVTAPGSRMTRLTFFGQAFTDGIRADICIVV